MPSDELNHALETLTRDVAPVVLAVEVGSRSHGWAHERSDSDVIAIVQHDLLSYAGLEQPLPSMEVVKTETLTLTAWDLRRTLTTIAKGGVRGLEMMRYEGLSHDAHGLPALLREHEQSLISIRGALGTWMNEFDQAFTKFREAEQARTLTARNILIALRPALMARAFDLIGRRAVPQTQIERLAMQAELDPRAMGALQRLLEGRRAGQKLTSPEPVLIDMIWASGARLKHAFETSPPVEERERRARYAVGQFVFEEMLRRAEIAAQPRLGAPGSDSMLVGPSPA